MKDRHFFLAQDTHMSTQIHAHVHAHTHSRTITHTQHTHTHRTHAHTHPHTHVCIQHATQETQHTHTHTHTHTLPTRGHWCCSTAMTRPPSDCRGQTQTSRRTSNRGHLRCGFTTRRPQRSSPRSSVEERSVRLAAQMQEAEDMRQREAQRKSLELARKLDK